LGDDRVGGQQHDALDCRLRDEHAIEGEHGFRGLAAGFPRRCLAGAGYQLDRVQRGLDPDDGSPMPSIGAGVREIRVRERAGAFRVIYLATFADVLYVLHAFQKKTRQTAKRDADLAASRLREQVARRR
jgi:phage-related protein